MAMFQSAVDRNPGYAPAWAGLAEATWRLAIDLLAGKCARKAGALITALTVVRTVLEDRTLIAELPGYADYAQRTRYRLVPGVW